MPAEVRLDRPDDRAGGGGEGGALRQRLDHRVVLGLELEPGLERRRLAAGKRKSGLARSTPAAVISGVSVSVRRLAAAASTMLDPPSIASSTLATRSSSASLRFSAVSRATISPRASARLRPLLAADGVDAHDMPAEVGLDRPDDRAGGGGEHGARDRLAGERDELRAGLRADADVLGAEPGRRSGGGEARPAARARDDRVGGGLGRHHRLADHARLAPAVERAVGVVIGGDFLLGRGDGGDLLGADRGDPQHALLGHGVALLVLVVEGLQIGRASGSARRGSRAVSTNTSSPRRCSSSIEA